MTAAQQPSLKQRLFGGSVLDRIGTIGLTAAGLSFLAFGGVTQGWQVYVLFAVSAFDGFAMPAMQAMVSRMVDASRQGQLQGGLGAMGSVSAIVAPLLLTLTTPSFEAANLTIRVASN